ncbi:MAG TPA: HEXXH motif-containing putative peptide modification protein [Thermoanaerobaculia bacterium]|nr:HEXXH motif-containing putative peptide modification protein [Thermoanaerobaculia bacterium]
MKYLVVEHARAMVRSFLDLHGDLLALRMPVLFDFLEAASSADVSFEAAWSPAFGRVAALAFTESADADEICAAAVEFAWHLAAEGTIGRWSANVASPLTLRLGRFVLPPATSVTAEHVDGSIQFSLRLVGGTASDYRFARQSSCWIPSERCGPFHSNEEIESVTFLTQDAGSIYSHAYLDSQILPTDRLGIALGAHRRAMRLLDDCAPAYARWVRRLLRTTIPLETRTGGINSGSSREEPGVIHASIDCAVEGYSEMLVHEVTHQHFYVLARLGAVEDGSDKNLYYSPFKQTGRPIAMILLAYHAFANVVLLGRACRRSAQMMGSDYFERNEAFLLPQIEVLEQALQQTRGLTPIGSALWEPLAEQLRARE